VTVLRLDEVLAEPREPIGYLLDRSAVIENMDTVRHIRGELQGMGQHHHRQIT